MASEEKQKLYSELEQLDISFAHSLSAELKAW